MTGTATSTVMILKLIRNRIWGRSHSVDTSRGRSLPLRMVTLQVQVQVQVQLQVQVQGQKGIASRRSQSDRILSIRSGNMPLTTAFPPCFRSLCV